MSLAMFELFNKRRVYIASPYSGDVARNVAYAKAAMLDAIKRFESPIVPHLLYPEVLDDTDPKQRVIGLELAMAWIEPRTIRYLVAYEDYGVSQGMSRELHHAQSVGVDIVRRKIL